MLVSACERAESDASLATPYAARLATTNPAYVRTAATVRRDTGAKPVETFALPQYTAAQSREGAAVYSATCARCHANAQWTGDTFAAAWQDRRLSDFHDLISVTMPQDNPGGLTPRQYLDVTAYVLELAGFPSGNVELRGDSATLRHTRLAITPPPPRAVTTNPVPTR